MVVTTEMQNDDTQTSTPPVTELLYPNERNGEHHESNENVNVQIDEDGEDNKGLDDEEFHSSITDEQNDISPLAEEIVYHTPLKNWQEKGI